MWYTDTSFWQEAEEGTDTDWKWADDWDVDYSVYYDKSSSTLDARQAVEIFEDEKLRSLTFSVHNGKNTLLQVQIFSPAILQDLRRIQGNVYPCFRKS